MTKRILIDSTHAEETRVVVLDGNRLEDFDVETSTKKQLKGNIYLAKVVRVEPSLQAAFVEYGGGRHGFLAFGEIHPDYYQIPVADRQRLLALQAEEARAEEEDEDDAPPPPRAQAAEQPDEPAEFGETTHGEVTHGELTTTAETDEPGEESSVDEVAEEQPAPESLGGENDTFEGNGAEEASRRRAARFLRNYRIQEVIRRRQVLLIQVVKEERGTKGAALTTYISLAGRFCVLMPNSPRGGGISRKITSAADRRRLKEITAELEIPAGMGLIVRTAGAARPKPEIKRDCEYLMRLWDDIREHTLRSMAPALIYEEASLIKRTIRDVYSRDIDEVMVDGDEGWKAAHDFMRMLMPSHAKKVQLWRTQDGARGMPLFVRHGVDAQLDAMMSPTVQLKSGGYLVINQAEALVAIDVNSGRSTRERGIEETALRTNLEAADEVARQLRLRDLAGLIVIDFIDMEARKHNAMVEQRLKNALKNDRARIQVGSISHFGLLEMSRQRLRPSLTETNFITCPHCNGLGHVRSTESSAIHVLRAIEEEGAKARASLITVHAAASIVLYLLNHKRERLQDIEQRMAMRVHFAVDDSLMPPNVRIERLKPALSEAERAAYVPVAAAPPPSVVEEEVEEDIPDLVADAPDEEDEEKPAAAESADEAERRRKRRRRRRGGRREDGTAEAAEGDTPVEPIEQETVLRALPAETIEGAEPVEAVAVEADAAGSDQPAIPTEELDENGLPKPRRRGRRGGRRRRREDGSPETEGTEEPAAAAEPEPVAPPPAPTPVFAAPAYTGPTPANPFGGQPFDIFDIMEQAERAQEEAAARPAPAPAPAPVVTEPAAAVIQAPAPVEVAVIEPPAPAPAEPVATAPAVDPSIIQPVLVGQDTVVTAPKRGWWNRSHRRVGCGFAPHQTSAREGKRQEGSVFFL
jgi:ribonuclease E